MRRTAAVIAILALGALALTACSPTVGDRSTGSGKDPDRVEGTTDVVLFQNADKIPNIAYFCADGYGWASTLTEGDGGDDKAATLVRFEEYDVICSDQGE